MAVLHQRPLNMLKGPLSAPALCVDGSQIVKALLLLLAAPCGLEKGVVALLIPSLIKQAQPKQIVGLAVIGVGISLRQAL